MTMRTLVVGTCRDCQQDEKRIVGRGLCRTCYGRHWRAGTLDEFVFCPRTPEPIPTEKPCAICKVALPLDAFPVNAHRSDGRGSYCKPCAKAKYHDPARERKRRVQRPTEGVLICVECKEEKSIDDFHWRSDSGKFRPECKACISAQNKAYREADPLAYRDRVMRRKYGIGLVEFDAMLAAQGGGCAICKATVNPDANSLAVDHCHTNGAVRGILCGRCNKALGLFQDDPSLLERAVIYLRK